MQKSVKIVNKHTGVKHLGLIRVNFKVSILSVNGSNGNGSIKQKTFYLYKSLISVINGMISNWKYFHQISIYW